MSKKIKHLSTTLLVVASAFLLSGCSAYRQASYPGRSVLNILAKHVGGYGPSLIILTLIVVVVMIPFTYSQMKRSTAQQTKIGLLEPKISYYQKRIKKVPHSDKKKRSRLNKRLLDVYLRNHITLLGSIGIIPWFVQFVAFTLLYTAIYYSPEISHSYLLGIDLGSHNVFIALVVAAVSFVNMFVLNRHVKGSQRKQIKWISLFGPLFIFLVIFGSPAGVGVYFLIQMLVSCGISATVDKQRGKMKDAILKHGLR